MLIQDAVSSVRNSSEKNVKVVVIVQDSKEIWNKVFGFHIGERVSWIPPFQRSKRYGTVTEIEGTRVFVREVRSGYIIYCPDGEGLRKVRKRKCKRKIERK